MVMTCGYGTQTGGRHSTETYLAPYNKYVLFDFIIKGKVCL